MGIKNLTTNQIENIQIDEGVIFLDYGLSTQRLLAPTRGGGEFNASVSVRDIEFDGRHGKTKGMQVIEEQNATLKVTTIDMSQENLVLAIPNCVVESDDGKTIRNPRCGIVADESYIENVTMFCKTIGGLYKKITLYNAMHETGFTAKAVQKAEGELALEFNSHYETDDLDGTIWEVKDVSSYAAPIFVSAVTTTATKISVTFNEELDSATLTYGNFTVLMSDASKAVSAAALKTGDAKVVELTVATLTAGKTVTVAYTKGTLKGKNGISVESFAAQPVSNTLT
jgi:hypothetical protein